LIINTESIGTNSTPLFIKKALMTLKKSLELKSTGGESKTLFSVESK
jgi:hypothetical protein